jgi:DNA-binding XRE family transcriptional regulator
MQNRIQRGRCNKLRELRRAQNLSQWGLAVNVGTSTATLSAVERWGYRPGAALCERIAAALGVSINDIWPEGEAQSAWSQPA